jgi:hypothetical protein
VDRVVLAVGLAAVAAAAAAILRRRLSSDVPTQVVYLAPTQLDRNDFAGPDLPWLVALFTSADCSTCALVRAKAAVLASDEVVVDDVEVTARPALHKRYRVEAVPIVVIADADGVVRASFIGPVSATDLWAAVAEVREPGSSPEPHLGHDHP